MNIKKYDVAIAYRTYPSTNPNSNRPIFQNNKLKLVELCLKSLKKSLGSLKVKLWAFFDSCQAEWDVLFKKYFDDNELEIIHLQHAGDLGSYVLAMSKLIEQNDSEIVCMAEDDYFYLPNQFEKMIKFMRYDNEVDFITPYDHSDYYNLELHEYLSKRKEFADKPWKTVSTTTGTFLTSKKNLKKTKNVLLRYSKIRKSHLYQFLSKNKILTYFFRHFNDPSTDADIWLSLTKLNVFKFVKISKYKRVNQRVFYIYFRAWRYSWRQILFGRKWNLWCPSPSIATHMEKDFLPPGIDWNKVFKEEIKKMELE